MSGDEVVKRPEFTMQGRKHEVGTTLDGPNGAFTMTINFTKMVEMMPDGQLYELYKQITDEMIERKAGKKPRGVNHFTTR